MRRFLLLAPLLLVACFGNRNGGEIGPNDLVVCVRNELAASGNIMARAGTARFDVMPGATSCRRVDSASPQLTMTATTVGGGAAGPGSFSEPLPSTVAGCWLWRIGPGNTDIVAPIDCAEVGSLQG